MRKHVGLSYDKVSSFFKENFAMVVLLCITEAFFNALMCLVPVLQGRAIDSFAESEPFGKLALSVAVFIGLVLFVQFNRYCKRYLGRSFEHKITLRMRQVSYKNLIHTPMSHFDKVSKGDILNKMLTDIADAGLGISKMTMEIFDTIILLVGYLITMFWMDVQITCIVMTFVIISILSARFFKYYINKHTREYKEYLSNSKEITLICLKNELNYRGYGVNETYYNAYRDSQNILEKKSIKSMIMQSCLEPIYSILTWMGLFFIVWIGGNRVIAGTLSVGVFSAFLSTYIMVAQKASRIGRVYGWYQDLRISWERCLPYLRETGDERKRFCEKTKELELKGFSFGFDKEFQLSKIDLTVKRGEWIGICGSVHTGKSTLLAGLSGLYPYKGSARLFGNDIEDTKCEIGYCSSESLIFADTLIENIRMGREGDWKKAMEDAGLSADVEQFSDGENQILSHSQINLSGGQQKRLMLARAIYNEPGLVLLDDPFASIDKENVGRIIERLKVYKNSIFCIVSNQSSLLKQMDRIIYLQEDGYDVGTFEELAKNHDFQAFEEVAG